MDGTYHALSDKLALPTYAQATRRCCLPSADALPLAAPPTPVAVNPGSAEDTEGLAVADDAEARTNIILECISSPSRTFSQSRTKSVGKLGDRHHRACTQIVPAA